MRRALECVPFYCRIREAIRTSSKNHSITDSKDGWMLVTRPFPLLFLLVLRIELRGGAQQLLVIISRASVYSRLVRSNKWRGRDMDQQEWKSFPCLEIILVLYAKDSPHSSAPEWFFPSKRWNGEQGDEDKSQELSWDAAWRFRDA